MNFNENQEQIEAINAEIKRLEQIKLGLVSRYKVGGKVFYFDIDWPHDAEVKDD